MHAEGGGIAVRSENVPGPSSLFSSRHPSAVVNPSCHRTQPATPCCKPCLAVLYKTKRHTLQSPNTTHFSPQQDETACKVSQRNTARHWLRGTPHHVTHRTMIAAMHTTATRGAMARAERQKQEMEAHIHQSQQSKTAAAALATHKQDALSERALANSRAVKTRMHHRSRNMDGSVSTFWQRQIARCAPQ